jgi:hypothetical protein
MEEEAERVPESVWKFRRRKQISGSSFLHLYEYDT